MTQPAYGDSCLHIETLTAASTMRAVRQRYFLTMIVFDFVLALGPFIELGYADDPHSLRLTSALQGGLPVVPVSIGTTERMFILDTGSTHHVFDTDLQPLLGSVIGTKQGTTATSATVFQLYRMPAANIRGFPIGAVDGFAVAADLSAIRKITGVDIRGIVGAPFFQNNIVRMDLPASVIEFLPSNTTPDKWGDRLEIAIDSSGRPYIKISGPYNSQPQIYTFLIDTADNREIGLANEIFDALASENRITLYARRLTADLVGSRHGSTGRLDVFHCGPFYHKGVLVERAKMNSLGLKYLSRFILTFAVRDRALYVAKSSMWITQWQADMSGLHLLADGDAVVVDSVDPESPAMRAGVLAGDIVRSVDGKSISIGVLDDLRALFRVRDGQSITLRLERGLEPVTVTIRLLQQPWDTSRQ